MKLLLVFAAVVLNVSTAPHYEKKFSKENGKLLKLKKRVSDPLDYFNWVEKGAVTSVKDQGKCASGYAFSAAGALEALFFIQNKTLIDVSVQELVDCSANNGCDGGDIDVSFHYVIDRPGINSNSTYPYVAKKNGKCLADLNKSVGYCSCDMEMIGVDEIDMLLSLTDFGPISAVIAVGNDFVNYKGGVFTGGCGKSLNHPVLIVGYGTDNDTNYDYWLVKNSWGPAWGENGYIRMRRNVNLCGIGDSASYPIHYTS